MSTSISVGPNGVGVITLDNKPVNSLCESLVQSFKQEFPKLLSNPEVKAIVVTGANGFFCGGAEITEFAKGFMMGKEAYKKMSPSVALYEMFDMIDSSPKTTVAAVNGAALGGGLELALACHYRLASPKASVGFPEVNLGLLPGGQGTQRIPRLAPLPVAIQLCIMGKPMKVDQARKNGVVDAVAKGDDVVGEAAALALSKKPDPVSQREVPFENKMMAVGGALDQALVMADRAAPGMVAPKAIVECLRAACSNKNSFRDGLKVEAEQFTELMFGVQSRALQHLFFAERAAQKVPGLTSKPAPIKKVGILGAGLMGGGIAMCFAEKGVPVVLKDAKEEWLSDGLKKIQGLWGAQAKRGKISEDKFKKLIDLIKPTLKYEDFSDVDMVIEAVPEIMDLKKQVFLDMEKHMRPDALICTNTSGLNIDDIASVLKDPSRVMGCHFFSPANVMQLLENIQTKESSDQTLATGMAMGKLIGKKAVMVGNCDGFVGNRMLAPYASEAKQLIEEGAGFEQVDSVATEFGMAMGPLSLGDLVGQELFWKQRKAAGDMKKQTKTYMGPYELGDWLCENGRFGMKTPDPKINATGRGIFIHRGRDKHLDPEVVAKMEEIRKAKGVTPRKVENEEIMERLFFSLINEGFKILEEGFVAKPSDIDIVYIFGYGFPPGKGGPMFFAENYVGLSKVLERIKVYAASAKQRYTTNSAYLPVDYFEPSKLLEACAAEEAKGTKAFPGTSLIEMTMKKFRKEQQAPGPFSKL